MESLLRNPAVAWFLLNLCSSTIIGFTDDSSAIRPAALPFFILYNVFLMPTYLHYSYHTAWANIACGQTLWVPFQYLEIALRRKWTFESHGYLTYRSKSAGKHSDRDTSLNAARATVWDRLFFGYWCTFAGRLCGTCFEVANVPLFSSKDPSYIPTRRQFYVQRILRCAICYAVLDLASSVPTDIERIQVLFASKNEPLLTRIGYYPMDLLAARAVTSIGLWPCAYCVIELYTNLAAFVRVGIGLDDVGFWRPNFGSIGESYSLRRFWGVFWHQHSRLKFSSLADCLLYDILHFRKGTLRARYAHLFLVFFTSGVFHVLLEVAQGTKYHESGATRFFVTQVLGIFIEDAIQAMYRSVYNLKRDASRPPPVRARWLGYVWVVAFLIWSQPVWLYPNIRARTGSFEDAILPFSFVQLVSPPAMAMIADFKDHLQNGSSINMTS